MERERGRRSVRKRAARGDGRISVLNAAEIIVDRATIFEWPQIEALRRAYFRSVGAPVQRRSDNTVWWIARIGERVVGCYSTEDAPEFNQRWTLDFYRVKGRIGTHAVKAMYGHLFAGADIDGLDVCFHVHPRNTAQLRAVEGHGCEPAGVLYRRPARR